MKTSNITQKGQVTIPVELRNALGIHPGDVIGFVKKNNHIVLTKQKSHIQESFGVVQSKRSVSLHDMEKSIIKGATDDNT